MKDEEILEILVDKDHEILEYRKALVELERKYKAKKRKWKADKEVLLNKISQHAGLANQYLSTLQNERARRDSDKAVLIDRAVTAERKAGVTMLPDKDGNPSGTLMEAQEPESRPSYHPVVAAREFFSQEKPSHATGGPGGGRY